MTKPVDAGILRLLRAATGHMTAAEIAMELGTAPEAIAGEITALKAAGYDIEEHPHFGFRFVSAPDRLVACDLSAMLDGVRLAREIIVFEKTDSTNDLAARMGRDGAAEGAVVFAETQTTGRGRLGRRWESDSHKGLWFSLLLRPRFSTPHWTRIATWAAVGIAEAIEGETGRRAQIKWPNDIYIGGKKVTGILIESQIDESGKGFAVLGIGVNVNQPAFPPELSLAASLRMMAGREFDRQQIAAAILRRLDRLHPQMEHDFERIVAAAESRSFLNGKWITASDGATRIEGRVLRLDPQGALVLQLPEGREHTLSSGEVTLASTGTGGPG
jgi:BirA family biotin operon repressor/biotin-[acetyl-CoA-carboxylase] ligase